MSIFWRS